jgi:hypothetical protein
MRMRLDRRRSDWRVGALHYLSGCCRGMFPNIRGGSNSAGHDRVRPERFTKKSRGRVAPGRCLPGAPTDPDVRNYRIRLFEAGFRYAPRSGLGFGNGYRC